MRISRFCEARGWYEADNSIESKIFCFGDEGGGNDGGGAAATDTEGLDDFGIDAGLATSNTVDSYAGAYGSDDSTDPGDRQDQYEGGYDYPSTPTTRDEIAAAAGVSSDTIVGSGKDGQGVVRSTSGSPVTSSRSVQEEAKSQGVTTSEIIDRINAAAAPQPGAGGSGTADDIFGYNDPFESMQFPSYAATPVTAQAAGPALAGTYSPVARAMTPFERTLAAASRPQTADEKLADLARTNRGAALQQYLDVNPNQSLSYANTYLDALIDADSIAALPSSPETQFKAREYSPVDAVNIFEQFEQPIGANNPPTALDPSRPMTQIRAATPADLITQEARAAANQLLGPERSRPTADEIAAANARLDARTPGLQEAIAEGIMPANIEGQYGMQPTTTEVDAYNAAINAEIADQLGVDVYNPVTYGVSPTDQITQVSTGPITQQDYANLAAGRGAIQGDMGVINQAAKEVALETGVSPQQAAQATGIASINQMYDQALAPYTSAPGPIGMDQVRADEINLERQQYEDYINTGKVGRDLASNEVVSFADFGGKELSSFKPGETVEERINQIANFSYSNDPRIASAAQQAIANTREDYGMGDPSRDYPTGGGLVSQPTPERGPGAVPTREDLNDIERAVAEEEAFRASQAAQSPTYTGVGALDYAPEPASDPLGESIDRAISDFAGYREGQTRTQTPDGVVVDDFMLTRDLVSQAPEYGAAYSPLEQLRMQEGTRTVPAVNVPDIDIFGMTIPTSIPGRVISDLVTPGSAVDRALQAGAKPIYDDKGRIEGAVDKYGVVYNVSPYDFESSDAMKAAQAEQAARQVAESQGGDGSSAPILPPIQETPAEATPEEYQGRDVIKPYQYQPRGPLSYAYTGLPSLAPTRLRPSYTAKKSFSPLFPVS